MAISTTGNILQREMVVKHILKLPSLMDHCPTEWRNFVQYHRDRYVNQDPDLEWGKLGASLLNVELKLYRAQVDFECEGDVSVLEFLTQQDYLMFKLAWA